MKKIRAETRANVVARRAVMRLSTPEAWMGETGNGKGGIWNWWVSLPRGAACPAE